MNNNRIATIYDDLLSGKMISRKERDVIWPKGHLVLLYDTLTEILNESQFLHKGDELYQYNFALLYAARLLLDLDLANEDIEVIYTEIMEHDELISNEQVDHILKSILMEKGLIDKMEKVNEIMITGNTKSGKP